ncbi:hypothetical protein BASA81_013689 [Batrachochytrium salamandrivorans]|nr:hypothetical protein BASA81_013689 [Batrachochytrium salamandrivorans]
MSRLVVGSCTLSSPSSSAAAMRRAISSSKANCMNAVLFFLPSYVIRASVKQAAESKAIEVKQNVAPPELTRHTARIYKPATPATQSGTAGSQYWKLDFDTQMKWARIRLWAGPAGYDYWVEEPKNSHSRVKVYAENFTYSPGKTSHDPDK